MSLTMSRAARESSSVCGSLWVGLLDKFCFVCLLCASGRLKTQVVVVENDAVLAVTCRLGHYVVAHPDIVVVCGTGNWRCIASCR